MNNNIYYFKYLKKILFFQKLGALYELTNTTDHSGLLHDNDGLVIGATTAISPTTFIATRTF